MAQKTIVHLIDDLDGGEGDESIEYTFDGIDYEIDLSTEHAADLRECLAPYLAVSRRKYTPRAQSAAPAAMNGRRKDLGDVRAWANENGYTVSSRGRIPTTVLEAYDRVH